MGGSRTPSECGEHRGADSSGGRRSAAGGGGGEAPVKSATSSVRGQPDAHSVASLESGEGDGNTGGAAAGSGWAANSALARKDTLTVQAALHYRRASAQLAGGVGSGNGTQPSASRTQSAADDEAASVCASVCSSTRAPTVTSDQICEEAKRASEKCSPSQSVAGSGPLGRDRDRD